MLTVWGRRSSSNVQALMWCIGELDLPVERHNAGFIYGVNDAPDFLTMNPNGRIPVLKDGEGEPLWETGAILRYIAGRYGDAPFWPKDAAARAGVDKWAEWAKLNVAHGFTQQIFWKTVRTAPKDRDEVAIKASLAGLRPFFGIAEAQLSRSTFLAGDAFTLADVQLGHVLYRYYDMEIPRPDLPALRHYYDALVERPVYREHVMVSYDELRVG